MKKIIVFCMLSMIMLFFVSCSPASELKKEYRVPSETGTVSNQDSSNLETDEIKVPKIDNETPYQELLTKEIDIHSFMEKYCTRSPYGSGDMEDIMTDIGIECLREAQKGALYSIHKVKQGGLLYVFYLNNDNLQNDYPVVRCIYMQRKLSSQDFATITEGTDIKKVKSIDPIAQIWENIYYSDPNYWNSTGGCGSIHYLSDGILEIGFQEQNGKVKVFATNYIEDYKMDYTTGKDYFVNGRILDTDWVE